MSNYFKEGDVMVHPSTHPHVGVGDLKITKQLTNGIMAIEGNGKVVHGHHGSIKIDGKCMKYVQLETNPVTGALLQAFD